MEADFYTFILEIEKNQCFEVSEFRLRFQKIWLRYLAEKDGNIRKELLRMIFEYQKFIANKKQKI